MHHQSKRFFPEVMMNSNDLLLLPNELSTFSNNYLLALQQAEDVHAVILFQVSYEEAMARRSKKGRKEDVFHSRKVRRQLEDAYGYWLNTWYLLFREKNKIALLIVDGDKPKDENVEIVKKFINDIT